MFKWVFRIIGIVVFIFIGLVVLGNIVGPQSEPDNRPEWVKSQFSVWDGSHKKLEKYVKSNLKDPKSYEHVSTKYVQTGNTLRVVMSYRAKNSFGAVVLGKTRAEVGKDGEIITIFESE